MQYNIQFKFIKSFTCPKPWIMFCIQQNVSKQRCFMILNSLIKDSPFNLTAGSGSRSIYQHNLIKPQSKYFILRDGININIRIWYFRTRCCLNMQKLSISILGCSFMNCCLTAVFSGFILVYSLGRQYYLHFFYRC